MAKYRRFLGDLDGEFTRAWERYALPTERLILRELAWFRDLARYTSGG